MTKKSRFKMMLLITAVVSFGTTFFVSGATALITTFAIAFATLVILLALLVLEK